MPRRSLRVALAVLALSVTAGAGACADDDPPDWLVSGDTTTSAAPATTTTAVGGATTTTGVPTTEPTPTPVTDLATGDCVSGAPFSGDPADLATDAEVTDCAVPHDGEVVGVVTYTQGPDDAYPGQDEVATFAQDQCATAFEDYVGVPYGSSSLSMVSLWPTEDSWAGGDREAVCVAFEPDAPLTASVAGRGR